jgi:phosphoserine phosphatase
VLALFDLDGTLTRHDTLWPYLSGFLRQHPARLRRVPRLLPALLRYALGRADRGELKSAALRTVMGGCMRAQIDAWTACFVARLLRDGLLEDARAALGFAETLCTGVKWDADRLEGSLTTVNRRGAEKARCVQALRLRYPQLPVVAYANAASDLEHLALAERATLVNGRWRARRAAARAMIPCLTWR